MGTQTSFEDLISMMVESDNEQATRKALIDKGLFLTWEHSSFKI